MNCRNRMEISKDRLRFTRCNQLIGQVLTPIMREYMQLTNVPPASVFTTIMQPYCKTLRSKLKQEQMSVIQTLQSDGYTNFDITLMYKIARDKHFGMLITEVPTRWWGSEPLSNEIRIGDDIERIRLGRDSIMHNPNHLMSEKEFDSFFDKFINVGKRANEILKKAPGFYEQQIRDIRHCHIDPTTHEKLIVTLKENEKLKEMVQLQRFHVFMGKEVEKYIEKIHRENEDSNGTVRIQMVLNGIENPPNLAEIINSRREEIKLACKECLIELDEAHEGSLILYLDVQKRVFQSESLLHAEIDRFLEILFKVISLESEISIYKYILIFLDESYETDTSSDEDENPAMEMYEKKLVIDLTVNKKAFQKDKFLQKHLLNFVGTLVTEVNGFQNKEHTDVTAVLKLNELDHYQIIKYNMDALPRLKDVLHSLNKCIKEEGIRDNILIDTKHHPRAIFCNGESHSDIDSFYFQNQDIEKMIVSTKDLNTAHMSGIPTVFVCVLITEHGHLSRIDKSCLMRMRNDLPYHWIDNTLFVVTAPSFSVSNRDLQTLSHDICKELDVDTTHITHRIYKHKDEDIFERMSITFENQLLHDSIYRKLHSLLDKVGDDIQHLESPTCGEEFRMILLNGPFGVELNDILRRATRLCVWVGPSFTRNRSIVTEAKKKITAHACEELGKEIIETVIHNLNIQLGSSNFNVFGVICQHIYLEDFKTTILKHILLILLNLFWGWIINVVLVLIAGVNINSVAFRNDLARNMYDQIYQNKNKIISEVVNEICSTAIQKYKDLGESLLIADEELHKIIIENGKDKIENEFRRITKINERIRDCKFEHGSLKIYARGSEKYYTEIKEFVDTYYRPDVVTEIIMDKKSEGS